MSGEIGHCRASRDRTSTCSQNGNRHRKRPAMPFAEQTGLSQRSCGRQNGCLQLQPSPVSRMFAARRVGMFKPTEEQSLALEKFRTGETLKVIAFAGAGKTSTLTLLAKSRPTRGFYLAFNRSIAAEASEKFPKTVDCRTTHSIAWRTVQPRYRFSSAKMKESVRARQLAEILQLKDRVFAGVLKLTGIQQAHLLRGTLRGFCQSADTEILPIHVPEYGRLAGAPAQIVSEIRASAVAEAMALWKRMIAPNDRIPLGHDGYLKLWALGRPKFDADFILLDEAQDTNPVVLDVLTNQVSQIVYVGDRHQQIYEWRGAINAMDQIKNAQTAYLTQSFRFGQGIASAASQVLATLGETHPVRGNPSIHSVIGDWHERCTVLARTNATVMMEALEALNSGWSAFIVGGVDELKNLLSDVFDLKAGKPASSPEFFGFQNWNEVVGFAETEEGQDLRTFVQLVEKYGERALWAAVSNTHQDELTADIVISTAHKAKGREWDSVRLAPDFLSSQLVEGSPQAEAEVRLFYVAMTRAKRRLSVDPGMLSTFTSGAWKTRTVDGISVNSSSYSDKTPRRPAVETSKRQAQSTQQTNSSNTQRGALATWDMPADHVRTGHPGAVRQNEERAPVFDGRRTDTARSRQPGMVDRTPDKSMQSNNNTGGSGSSFRQSAPISDMPADRVRAGHPGAAPSNAGPRPDTNEKVSETSGSRQPGMAERKPEQTVQFNQSGKPSFWKRVARLFGS